MEISSLSNLSSPLRRRGAGRRLRPQHITPPPRLPISSRTPPPCRRRRPACLASIARLPVNHPCLRARTRAHVRAKAPHIGACACAPDARAPGPAWRTCRWTRPSTSGSTAASGCRRAHTHTHIRTHIRTHARTHAHSRAHTHTLVWVDPPAPLTPPLLGAPGRPPQPHHPSETPRTRATTSPPRPLWRPSRFAVRETGRVSDALIFFILREKRARLSRAADPATPGRGLPAYSPPAP